MKVARVAELAATILFKQPGGLAVTADIWVPGTASKGTIVVKVTGDKTGGASVEPTVETTLQVIGSGLVMWLLSPRPRT